MSISREFCSARGVDRVLAMGIQNGVVSILGKKPREKLAKI